LPEQRLQAVEKGCARLAGKPLVIEKHNVVSKSSKVQPVAPLAHVVKHFAQRDPRVFRDTR
jgi:hypothetical protein